MMMDDDVVGVCLALQANTAAAAIAAVQKPNKYLQG
jgi:hypothetical protein